MENIIVSTEWLYANINQPDLVHLLEVTVI